jgi:hypothetical protein
MGASESKPVVSNKTRKYLELLRYSLCVIQWQKRSDCANEFEEVMLAYLEKSRAEVPECDLSTVEIQEEHLCDIATSDTIPLCTSADEINEIWDLITKYDSSLNCHRRKKGVALHRVALFQDATTKALENVYNCAKNIHNSGGRENMKVNTISMKSELKKRELLLAHTLPSVLKPPITYVEAPQPQHPEQTSFGGCFEEQCGVPDKHTYAIN